MAADLTKLTADIAQLAADAEAAATRVQAAIVPGPTQADIDALDATVATISATVNGIAPDAPAPVVVATNE